MKKLYITSHGDLRKARATADEVRAFIEGENSPWEQLVTMDMDADGDIMTTPITADELAAMRADLETEQGRELVQLLDDMAAIVKRSTRVAGCSWPSLVLWAERAHKNMPAIVEDWAAKNGYEIKRSSPPTSHTRWTPDMTVASGYRDIVRVIWPSTEVNTDKVVEEEIVKVRADREMAERELEAVF